MKAKPDDFMLLICNEFSEGSLGYITETHAEFWQEDLNLSLDGGVGSIDLPEAEIRLAVDEPIPEIADFAAQALEPFGASDLAMIQRHTSTWRVVASGPFSAWPLVRIASTLVESGASAVFVPRTRQLHSPRAVQRFAMDAAPDALANFWVSAFDGDGWMRTRGLTAFHMPELITQIKDGHNAAYFRLMDVAAAMIENGRAFDDGASLTLGPNLHTIASAAHHAIEDTVEINGLHGVQTLL